MNSMYGGMGTRSNGNRLRGNSGGQFNDKIPSGYKAGTLQKFTPEALDLYKQLFSNLRSDSYLSKLAGGDEEIFNQIEQPAWRDFQTAQGQLGNRFAQLAPGAMSAQRGSGFQNSANQASQDFAMQLQANRHNLSRQALSDLFNMSNVLFQNQPYERTLSQKPEKPALGGWGGAVGGALGAAGGFAIGGPAGAFAGGSIGADAFKGL